MSLMISINVIELINDKNESSLFINSFRGY